MSSNSDNTCFVYWLLFNVLIRASVKFRIWNFKAEVFFFSHANSNSLVSCTQVADFQNFAAAVVN